MDAEQLTPSEVFGGRPFFERRVGGFYERVADDPVDAEASRRLLAHMRASLDEQALPPELDATVWRHFEAAVAAMINSRGASRV